MNVRATVAAAMAALGLAVTGTPADATTIVVPVPGLVWAVDGSGNAEPLGGSVQDGCGLGRSRLVKDHYDDHFGNIEIHLIVKACITQVGSRFMLENRMFVCERHATLDGACEAGTTTSGAQVTDASSSVQYRADGGQFLFGFDHVLTLEERNRMEQGSMIYHVEGLLDGAPGHSYGAWGYADGTIGGTFVSMYPDRVSKTAEYRVS